MSYIVLSGRCFNIIFLNAHAPTKKKSDDSMDSFYEDLEQIFDHFLNHTKNLLADFNAKLARENIFKPTTGNESLPQDSNDNGVRIVNCHIKKSSC